MTARGRGTAACSPGQLAEEGEGDQGGQCLETSPGLYKRGRDVIRALARASPAPLPAGVHPPDTLRSSHPSGPRTEPGRCAGHPRWGGVCPGSGVCPDGSRNSVPTLTDVSQAGKLGLMGPDYKAGQIIGECLDLHSICEAGTPSWAEIVAIRCDYCVN